LQQIREIWGKKLTYALWESQLTPKESIRQPPYTLVYGKEARLPIHLELIALILVYAYHALGFLTI